MVKDAKRRLLSSFFLKRPLLNIWFVPHFHAHNISHLALQPQEAVGWLVLWEPYPSHHNGLFSPLLELRDFAARGADQSRFAPLPVPGSTSTGRVICGTDLAKCVSVPGDFLRPQGAFPSGFYLLREGWVHRKAPEAPLTRGMPTGQRAFLANSGRVWATALRPVPPKKGLVQYMPVRWGVHQIPQINLVLHLSRCRVALRPAVLSAAQIWPSVSRYQGISFGLRDPSP